MIRRIVKLQFHAHFEEDFRYIFEKSKEKIRNFPGCLHLELWRAKGPDTIFMTYSHWESEDALNQYRHSELFQQTWAKTKVLFSAKPEAWSLDLVHLAV